MKLLQIPYCIPNLFSKHLPEHFNGAYNRYSEDNTFFFIAVCIKQYLIRGRTVAQTNLKYGLLRVDSKRINFCVESHCFTFLSQPSLLSLQPFFFRRIPGSLPTECGIYWYPLILSGGSLRSVCKPRTNHYMEGLSHLQRLVRINSYIAVLPYNLVFMTCCQSSNDENKIVVVKLRL